MRKSHARSIPELLAAQLASTPALLSPGRAPMTYGQLADQVTRVSRRLRAAGIARHHRVALIAPNGPELAAAFLAVASASACAPLNPSYRAAEFEFYLTDLDPVAIVVATDLETEARAVAKSRGIRIIALSARVDDVAGAFDLDLAGEQSGMLEWPEATDVALVLHTSGTTARPKIVPLTHANLCASAANIRRTLSLDRVDRCLNVMPLFHIHGLVGAVLSSITAGGQIVCAPDFVAPRFFEWLDSTCPTWYTAVPTMHQAIVARAAAHADIIARRPLRFIRSSSAPLAPSLMAEIERVFAAPAIEAYGMTEAAHQMACNPLPPGTRKPGSVGPADGPEIAILDGRGESLPRGVVGNVAIRGENVMEGYAGAAGANEAAFINGWFRTGDEGRIDDEGYLFLTGRTKEIINRGGEKISPREVDEVLLEHPAVAQAVTFAMPDSRLGEEVGAAIVLRESSRIEALELMEFAGERLAPFKVPKRFAFVDAIPKGPTGKVQRIGLAAALGLDRPEKAETTSTSGSPATETAIWLVDVFRTLLDDRTIGIADDFFAHGGDSILAMQVTARIFRRIGTPVSPLVIFRFRNAAAVAAHLDTLPSRPDGPSGDDICPGHPLVASFAQERIWFLCSYENHPAAYVTPHAYRIRGRLDVAALEQSLTTILARHESLRTVFRFEDGRVQPLLLPPQRVRISLCDLSATSQDEREARAHEAIQARLQKPFDLSRVVLMRMLLVRLDATDHIALLQCHHIATDGWSTGVLWRELTTCYKAFSQHTEPALTALPIQYRDYAAWQRRSMEDAATLRQREFWLRELDGFTSPLLVPTDHPRPPRQTFNGARVRLVLPRELVDAIKALARDEGCTYFMALLAGFQILLFRYTRQERFCVGTPVAGRLRTETEALIGIFVNTLPLAADLSGAPTFRALLARVRRMASEAYANQELPLDQLIEALRPERNLAYPPLFQVLFQLRNYAPAVTALPDLEVTELPLDSALAQFDLTLESIERDDETECLLVFNRDLFDGTTAARLLGHYATLLKSAAREPDRPITDAALLTADERNQMLIAWNATGVPGTTEPCVHTRIDAQAQRTPDDLAVSDSARSWTYARLAERANQVAHFLAGRGLGRGNRVGVCLDRSVELVAALLGVLKSGASYVPLETDYPERWRASVIDDAEVSLVLDERVMDGDVGQQRTDQFESAARPEDPAYVIYTSGSTGTPKGVQVPHRALANVLESLQRDPGLAASATLLALAPVTFDIAAVELYLPLMAGAHVRLVNRRDAADPEALASLIHTSQASVVQATPATWRMLIDSGWKGVPGLQAWCGGEALPRDLANEILDRGMGLHNFYGPTETAVWSTACRVNRADGVVPIGKPLANTQVYVLDPDGQLAPMGVPGELYIGGAGVADGYVKRPDLTVERFVTLHFDETGPTRAYRTGDMVRWQRDGQLIYIERVDGQVKLRGHRIELGEVESALGLHASTAVCVALLREDTPGDRRLVAYLTTTGSIRPSVDELRAFLAARLPAYMIPSAFVILDAFPLTAHGKVDRRALPPPRGSATLARETRASADDALEAALLRIWTDVLSVDGIDVHDDFFILGGHSLLAVRLMAQIESVLGVRLPLASLFESATVAGQARAIRQVVPQHSPDLPVAIQRGGSRTPLFVIARFSPLGFHDLALALGPEQPVYGLEPPGLGDESLPVSRVEDLAAHYIKQIQMVQAEGPYLIGGYSFGGFPAYEIACQLERAGQRVALLFLIDTGLHLLPKYLATLPRRKVWAGRLRHWGVAARHHSLALRELPFADRLTYAADVVSSRRRARERARGNVEVDEGLPESIHRVERATQTALRSYVPDKYTGRTALICSTAGVGGYGPDVGWRGLAEHIEVHHVAGAGHGDILSAPYVEVVSTLISTLLVPSAEQREDLPMS